jgi:hypothetical protein
MTLQEAHKILNGELAEYIRLESESEKEAFWNRLHQESSFRAEEDKATLKEAIADDVALIRQRVMALRGKIEQMQEAV